MIAIKTVPFDATEYLDDPESQAKLIADALETGDAAYINHALIVVARARHERDRARCRHFARGAVQGTERNGRSQAFDAARGVPRARPETHGQACGGRVALSYAQISRLLTHVAPNMCTERA